jgi:hypothetical protein
MGSNQQQMAMQAAQVNDLARRIVAAQAVPMTQQIFATTIVPANGNVVNIVPRNVGLICGFWAKVVSVISNTTGGGTAITPTDFGGINLLSQIQFTDLSNNVRIQTPGWHINYIDSIKGREEFGSALLNTAVDGNNATGGYGANFTVNNTPATIADGGTGTVTQWFWIPLAYNHSQGDYRGAIYGGVVNATMQLQLTVNTSVVAAAANDTTNAVYKAAAGAGANTSTTITVYQEYLDQLPQGQGGLILPQLDLSTVYDIKQTTFAAITAGNDFPLPYANFRDFVSTMVVFNSTGGSAGRNAGSDVNYWALQSANFTNLWKVEPALAALKWRRELRCDFPKGVYYFGSRQKPISTVQYGNMELILNAASAGGSAYAFMATEAFALQNVITQAGSLPAS